MNNKNGENQEQTNFKKRAAAEDVDAQQETVIKMKKTRLRITFDENGAYLQNVTGNNVTVQKLHKDNEDIIRNIIAFHPAHLETIKQSLMRQCGFILNSQMFKNGDGRQRRQDDDCIKIPLPDIIPLQNCHYISVKNIEHLLMVVFNRIQTMFESLAELSKSEKCSIKKIVQFHNDVMDEQNDQSSLPLREGRGRFYCLACGSSPVCTLPCLHMWQSKRRRSEKQYCFNCLISSKLTLVKIFDYQSKHENMVQSRTPGKVFCDCDSSTSFMHYNLLMAISYNPLFFAPLIFRAALSDAIKVALMKRRNTLLPPRVPEINKYQFNMFGTMISKHVSNCDATRDIYMFAIDNLGNVMDDDCRKQQKLFHDSIIEGRRKKKCIICQDTLTIDHIFKYFHNKPFEQRLF